MGYRVIFSAQSNRDLGEIVRFLAQQNAAAAEKLGFALLNRTLALGQMPRIGMPVQSRPAVRRIFYRPWVLIYYRVDEASRCVEVLRFWDARRDPATLRLG